MAFGSKKEYTFTELLKSSGLNRFSFAKGLNDLEESKDVLKKGKYYSLKSPSKNVVLNTFVDSGVMTNKLEVSMKELKEHESPFELATILLNAVMGDLSHLTLEQHTAQLTKIEKEEFERAIGFCNKVIQSVFDILWEKDPTQTMQLKQAVKMVLNPAMHQYKSNTLNQKQKKLVKKLKEEIKPYVIRNLKK